MKMWNSLYVLFVISSVHGLWENEKLCPLQCSCRLQHITETAIHRYTQQDKEAQKHQSEAFGHENNEVLYDDDFIANFEEDRSILRMATCIIQTEMTVKDLLGNIPKDVNALTLIQGSDSGNKTVRISDLVQFRDLFVLELQGVNLKEDGNASNLVCEVDASLPWLEYLNLERVTLKNSLKKIRIIENEVNEEFTLEYVQKVSPNSKPLAFIKRGPPTEVLPYKEYVEQMKHNFASFKGFNSLTLLRISACDLNTLYWEIFEGLSKLEYLILEKNNLKFIPNFAFYGAPTIKTLSLAHNSLLNIQVTDLAGLLDLEYLDLSYNNFSQLSELSLPPFPKLKLANFGHNPISAVFPNTFEVLNTTDSIILGSDDTTLSILTNSFVGLKLLKKLTIRNLKIPVLQKEILVGMPTLKELILTGDIPKIEFDTFLDVYNLEKLIMNECNISILSVDSFMGLNRLKILDLSKNNLDYIPPGVFDVMPNLRELYLSHNRLTHVAKGMFPNNLRLIRLDNNPWDCSCEMSDWKPMLINRIKRKVIKSCSQEYDKGLECSKGDAFTYTYDFEPKVAPKCATPKKFVNHSVFHVMRKEFKCVNYKPKIKKINQPKFNFAHVKQFLKVSENQAFTSTENIEVLGSTSTEKLQDIEKSTKSVGEDFQKSTEKVNDISQVNSDVSTENNFQESNQQSNDLKTDFYPREINENFNTKQNSLNTVLGDNLSFNNENNSTFNGFKSRKALRRRQKKIYKKNIYGRQKRIN